MKMPNWKDEYLSSLRESEMNNPVNMELVQTCEFALPLTDIPKSPVNANVSVSPGSQMADRISALEAEKSTLEAELSTSPSKASAANTPKDQAASNDPGVSQLRLDLAEALRAKGVVEARLRTGEEELTKLRAKSKEDSRSIRDLTSDRTALMTRLKDRDHELREKRKLLEVNGHGSGDLVVWVPRLTNSDSKFKMK